MILCSLIGWSILVLAVYVSYEKYKSIFLLKTPYPVHSSSK